MNDPTNAVDLSGTTAPFRARMSMAEAFIRCLVLYSVAEAQAGHVSRIDVTARKTSFEVSDNGRGHSIDKTIGDIPYVSFIYEQVDFPFGRTSPGAVQLQGIGLSLITALCDELHVYARRSGEELVLHFAHGRMESQSRTLATQPDTGNTIRGSVDERLDPVGPCHDALWTWLREISQTVPGVVVTFNGLDVAVAPDSAA